MVAGHGWGHFQPGRSPAEVARHETRRDETARDGMGRDGETRRDGHETARDGGRRRSACSTWPGLADAGEPDAARWSGSTISITNSQELLAEDQTRESQCPPGQSSRDLRSTRPTWPAAGGVAARGVGASEAGRSHGRVLWRRGTTLVRVRVILRFGL